MSRCRGGYAVTILLHGYGILAFRDPYGVRPLCLGARPGGFSTSNGMSTGGTRGGESLAREGSGKMDLGVASESAALTGLGFALRRDVSAGEAVFLDVRTGSVAGRDCAPTPPPSSKLRQGRQGAKTRFAPCLFEYVYMARPDSILDGVPVRA